MIAYTCSLPHLVGSRVYLRMNRLSRTSNINSAYTDSYSCPKSILHLHYVSRRSIKCPAGDSIPTPDQSALGSGLWIQYECIRNRGYQQPCNWSSSYRTPTPLHSRWLYSAPDVQARRDLVASPLRGSAEGI